MENAQARMATAPAVVESLVHEQLTERRERLQEATALAGGDLEFARLLSEVDAALERFDKGTFGYCEECHDPIEPDRLLADPLVRVCLGDLTVNQRQALEDDLQLASAIQKGLLPKPHAVADGWEVDFVYQPAGIVSGDYVDVIRQGDELYFILGDVSGKGMAASLLMSSMHGMFHSLIPLGMPLCDLMSKANRLLCESTLSNQFATLVAGRASADGRIEICNAGHLPPVVLTGEGYEELNSAGLPLGMFSDVSFESSEITLGAEDTLVLFSDGVTEATNNSGEEFGLDGLLHSIGDGSAYEPAELVRRSLGAVEDFRGTAARTDDLTIMALKFAGARN